MSRLMRAIRVSEFGAPSVLKLCADLAVPDPPPTQVLIRVHACGVNPVETYIRSGSYARKPSLPYTPGTDVAGVVEAVGEGVKALKAGDRVFTTATETGGYAEYTLASLDAVHRLPDALDFLQGAAIGVPYFTAYRALFQRAQAKAGETVLIHGASGGVGVAACQLARGRGLRVLGTAGTPEGLELVLKSGAHQAFNHREAGYTSHILEATGGRGVGVIVEMLANVNLSSDLQMLSPGGRVTIVGSRGPIEINPRDTMAKESSIMGVALFLATPEEKAECAAALFAGLDAGWLRPSVGRSYALEDAAQAHHDIINCPGASGKMVLTMLPSCTEQGSMPPSCTDQTMSLSCPEKGSRKGVMMTQSKLYPQKYRKDWESNPEFKGWLKPFLGDDTRAYCLYCKADFYAKLSDVKKHKATQKHAKKNNNNRH